MPGALRGRIAAAAVAAGALATAGHSVSALESVDTSTTELAADSLALSSASTATQATNAAGAGGGTGTVASPATTSRPDTALDAATTGVMAVAATKPEADDSAASSGQVSSLSKARQRADAAAAAEAAEAAARAPKPEFVKPADGRFTSGFGARWGSSHKGVDIANEIGTPILSVAEGTVTEAGPASGFGQWVKVRHQDGIETVYGHVNRFFVSEGDTVKAGQRIAEIGNKGQSTGPHLHFEVHTSSGKKINPLPWLTERGISLGAQKD